MSESGGTNVRDYGVERGCTELLLGGGCFLSPDSSISQFNYILFYINPRRICYRLAHLCRIVKRRERKGCLPDVGWGQSGGDLKAAVAGKVYRLLGWRRAGTRPGRTGRVGGNTVGYTLCWGRINTVACKGGASRGRGTAVVSGRWLVSSCRIGEVLVAGGD